MRLRNNPLASEQLSEFPDIVVGNPESHKDEWNKLFGNNNPIKIEVGMGKGDFIIGNAIANPDVNFIGIEKYPTVAEIAMRKAIKSESPKNLRLLCFDGDKLEDIFADGEISLVYLNFSDPWPKARHAKRRLTYISFLKKYKKVLGEQKLVELKTDNDGLFEWTLEHLEEKGLDIVFFTRDLHSNGEHMENNIMTEYERKFSQTGKNINKVVFNVLKA